MKKNYLAAVVFWILPAILIGQTIEVCFGDRVCVKNNTNDKLLFHWNYGGNVEKFYLYPDKQKDIALAKINRKNVDKLTVEVVYDSSSYVYELNDIREEASDRKFKEAMYAAFFTAIDQFFLFGKVGEVLTKLEIATKILDGRSVEEWGADIVKSSVENKMIDDIDSHTGKTFAAVGFKVFEVMMQGQYPDLAERTKQAMVKLKRGKMKTLSGANMEYSLYPFKALRLAVGYQLGTTFVYSKIEDLEYTNNLAPFSLELKYFISNRTESLSLEDDAIQLVPSFALNNTPIFYKLGQDSVFSDNKAFSLINLQPSLGLKLNLRPSPKFALGGELQAGYNFGTKFTYNYENMNNEVSGFDRQKTKLFSNNQLMLSIGLSLNMNIGSVFAEIVSFGSGEDKEFGGTYMTAGVEIPLFTEFNFAKPERSKTISWSNYY